MIVNRVLQVYLFQDYRRRIGSVMLGPSSYRLLSNIFVMSPGNEGKTNKNLFPINARSHFQSRSELNIFFLFLLRQKHANKSWTDVTGENNETHVLPSHWCCCCCLLLACHSSWCEATARERNEKFIDRYQLYLIEDHRYQQIIYVLQSTPYATPWMASAGGKKKWKTSITLDENRMLSMSLIKIDRRVRRALSMRRRGCTTC